MPGADATATYKRTERERERERGCEEKGYSFPSIPVAHEYLPERSTACCCGKSSCAFLRHNNEALDCLERDVKTAAQLGQALLVRHEAYVSEAENTKWEMNQRIDYLERNKRELEDENARILQENRDLLDQLEQLNTSSTDSQAHIESLEATLHSTNLEIRRLEGLANRAQELEIQVIELEREQLELTETLTSTESEERTALRRWRAAERKLKEVQEQLERIENEAHNEKLRHEEVLRRMERQRLVDKELEEKTTVSANNGQNVVGHFVKDILQDNVNLQMGIVELREMLMNSNDEVQKLREQLMAHQPLEEAEAPKDKIPLSLDAEIASKEPPAPAVHVHHHYHVPTIKKEDGRRTVPRRKRGVALPVNSGFHSRSSSRSRIRPAQASIAATILSQTSTTVPSPRGPKRWSAQSYGGSDFASSAPSSPQSNYRNSVLFDRMSMDQTMEYSRPTSPDSSIDPMSPAFRPSHRKKISEFSVDSRRARSNETIHEEDDTDVPDMSPLEAGKDQLVTHDDLEIGTKSEQADTFDPFSDTHHTPKLRRSNSHESILSIAGTDIHTLQSRPSQISITKNGSFVSLRHAHRGPSSAVLSLEPVLGTAELSAPTTSTGKFDSRSLLRSTAGLPQRPGSSSSNDTLRSIENKKPAGGWIWGRWGISPKPSNGSLSSDATSSIVNPAAGSDVPRKPTRAVTMPIKRLQKENEDPLKMMLGRSPGINQSGPIPGWKRPPRAPSQVVPTRVDFEALREVLEED